MLKRHRDDEDKDEEPSARSDRGSKRRRAGKEPELTSAPKEKASKTSGKSTEGSKSHQETASESTPAEEPMHITQDLEEPAHQEFETCATDNQPIAKASQHPEWKPPLPDRAWNAALPAAQGDAQSRISELAKQADERFSFNELLDTPIPFSNFIIHRLNVDTLTPDLLAGPTYEPGVKKIKKGGEHASASTPSEPATGSTGKSTTGSQSRQLSTSESAFTEEPVQPTCQIEEPSHPVFETGQQYPHNLLKPLPRIPNSQGRRVIPFAQFINNEHEYLRGGALSRKYTSSVTKTKAADYGHIKWIEDLVPRIMWSQEPISYDKYALWG
nr:hypothetical protein [Tanacetum cinerariifolium]